MGDFSNPYMPFQNIPFPIYQKKKITFPRLSQPIIVTLPVHHNRNDLVSLLSCGDELDNSSVTWIHPLMAW